MPADPLRASRQFERAMISALNGSLCGVVLDSETAAWADAAPSMARGVAIESGRDGFGAELKKLQAMIAGERIIEALEAQR